MSLVVAKRTRFSSVTAEVYVLSHPIKPVGV
jgi:hypothetical protein